MFESRPGGLPRMGGEAETWKWRPQGRTTGGAERTETHLTRLVTPKGSADIVLFGKSLSYIEVRGFPLRINVILSLGAMG